MKLFELIFDDENDDNAIGLYGVSLVNATAVEFESVQLSQDTRIWNDELINTLKSIGRTPLKYDNDYVLMRSEQINSIDDLESLSFASEDTKHFEIRYRYAGGLNLNSRDFCRTMIAWNREWTRDDIALLNDLNPGFGKNGSESYDVILYKGGVNCKHYFERVIYWKSKNSELTYDEALKKMPKNIVKQIPKIDKKVGQIASASNNYWRANFSDEKKRMLTQPILIPNQKIYRNNIQGGEAHVFVSADTIEKLAKNFFKQGYQTNSSIEHDENQEIKEGFFIWESWIVADSEQDKSKKLGFDVPVGTWMVTAQLSPELWEKYVETGEIKGLSIDALLNVKEVKDVDNEQIKLKNETKKMNKKSFLAKVRERVALKFSTDAIVIDAELGYSVPQVAEGEIVTDADGNVVADFRFTFEGVEYITDESGAIALFVEEEVAEEIAMEEEIEEVAVEEIAEEVATIVEEIAEEMIAIAEQETTDKDALIAELQAKIADLESKINAVTPAEESIEFKESQAKKIGFNSNKSQNSNEDPFLKLFRK